jgi:uncharacterized protein YbbC (DUF1343 family)
MQTHLVDFLLAQKISILKIFAPEHGFAGLLTLENILSTEWILQLDYLLFMVVIKTNVRSIKGIDIMVLIYKMWSSILHYISSLHYIMEACAENNIH